MSTGRSGEPQKSHSEGSNAPSFSGLLTDLKKFYLKTVPFNEKELETLIERFLSSKGHSCSRQMRKGARRLDLFVDGSFILEVKNGLRNDPRFYDQLEAYGQLAQGVIVISTWISSQVRGILKAIKETSSIDFDFVEINRNTRMML